MDLTFKQRKFIKNYIYNNGNATKAVIDAGYRVKNRSTASVIGYENLIKPKVREALTTHFEGTGLDLETICKDLKMSIEEGMGINATSNDALKGLELLLRVHGTI